MLEVGRVCVLIHSGSRGLGYQVCDDALRMLRDAPRKYGVELPDRQLVCAPVRSPEGEQYLGAMRAAANYAFCNRQLIMWQTREVFAEFFGRSWQDMGMSLVYDVAHNIATFEDHEVDGVITSRRGLDTIERGTRIAACVHSPCSALRAVGIGARSKHVESRSTPECSAPSLHAARCAATPGTAAAKGTF